MPRGSRGAPTLLFHADWTALASKAEIHYEAIRDLIASGMTDSEALARDPDYPPLSTWSGWLTRHPDRKAEIVSLRPGRATPGIDAIAANFDAMLALVEQGHSPESAGKVLGVFGRKLHDYLRANPDKRPAYVAAVKRRERGPNRRGTKISVAPKRKRWTVDQFDAAVAFILRHVDLDLEGALRSANLPSTMTMYHRANRNPAFRKRFYNAMASHTAQCAYLHGAESDEPNLLLGELLKNDLFAAAFNRFKKFHEVRYDLVQEFVLAVLEGRLTKADLKNTKAMRDIRKRALGSSFEFQSLDAPAYDDGESRDSLGDTIASPCGISIY
jgi:hypothetical protein